MLAEEQRFICNLSHFISLSGKHTFIVKHTEMGVKMTSLPGSFGFTLLISQASKQSTVLLYVCKEQQIFFLLEFTTLLLHLIFLMTIEKILKKNKQQTNQPWFKALHALKYILKKWALFAAIREHCEFRTGKSIADGYHLRNWVMVSGHCPWTCDFNLTEIYEAWIKENIL